MTPLQLHRRINRYFQRLGWPLSIASIEPKHKVWFLHLSYPAGTLALSMADSRLRIVTSDGMSLAEFLTNIEEAKFATPRDFVKFLASIDHKGVIIEQKGLWTDADVICWAYVHLGMASDIDQARNLQKTLVNPKAPPRQPHVLGRLDFMKRVCLIQPGIPAFGAHLTKAGLL